MVSLVLAFFIYRSSDESFWYDNYPEEATKAAISLGRDFAFNLLIGNRERLMELSFDPAKTMVAHAELRQVSLEEIRDLLKGKQIDDSLRFALWPDDSERSMELVAYQRTESFVVMTFAYKYPVGGSIVEIPGKGKMLFSIAERLYHPFDDRLIPTIARRIGNLPWVQFIAGPMGTSARWVCFDFAYNFSLSDYFDWVLKEGENQAKALGRRRERFPDADQLNAGSDRGLTFLYDWGLQETKSQIERSERLYRLLNRAQGD
jgi:hypothetical protein